MILLMSSLNSAIIQTYEQVIHSSYGGNLDVEFHHIEKTDLEQLKKIEGVADAETYPLYSAVWTLNGQKRKLPVYGVGEEWIDRFPLFAVSGTTHSELIRQLDEQELILDQIAYGIWGGTIGETITLETLRGPRPFTVAGVVNAEGAKPYAVLQQTSLYRVMGMAEAIVRAVVSAVKD
ncbi:hypothetical protein, partial [Micromonospora schwarzwaldensis]